MIEIAEKVFISIARQLGMRQTSIKTLFNKPDYITKIAFFDGEQNVATILPTKLIEGLQSVLALRLTDAEKSALTTVLGNQEIGGAIVLHDLETIVDKYKFEKRKSLRDPSQPDTPSKHKVTFKEDAKANKHEIFKNYPDIARKLKELNNEATRAKLVQVSSVQSFKSKDKTKEVQIVKYQDFLVKCDLQKSELELIKAHLVLSQKYDQIFALKHCLRLFEDASLFLAQS